MALTRPRVGNPQPNPRVKVPKPAPKQPKPEIDAAVLQPSVKTPTPPTPRQPKVTKPKGNKVPTKPKVDKLPNLKPGSVDDAVLGAATRPNNRTTPKTPPVKRTPGSINPVTKKAIPKKIDRPDKIDFEQGKPIKDITAPGQPNKKIGGKELSDATIDTPSNPDTITNQAKRVGDTNTGGGAAPHEQFKEVDNDILSNPKNIGFDRLADPDAELEDLDPDENPNLDGVRDEDGYQDTSDVEPLETEDGEVVEEDGEDTVLSSWDQKAEDQAQQEYDYEAEKARSEAIERRKKIMSENSERINEFFSADYNSAQKVDKFGWTGGQLMDAKSRVGFLQAGLNAKMYQEEAMNQAGLDSKLAIARKYQELKQTELAEKYYQEAVTNSLSRAQITGYYISPEATDMINNYAIAVQEGNEDVMATVESYFIGQGFGYEATDENGNVLLGSNGEPIMTIDPATITGLVDVSNTLAQRQLEFDQEVHRWAQDEAAMANEYAENGDLDGDGLIGALSDGLNDESWRVNPETGQRDYWSYDQKKWMTAEEHQEYMDAKKAGEDTGDTEDEEDVVTNNDVDQDTYDQAPDSFRPTDEGLNEQYEEGDTYTHPDTGVTYTYDSGSGMFMKAKKQTEEEIQAEADKKVLEDELTELAETKPEGTIITGADGNDYVVTGTGEYVPVEDFDEYEYSAEGANTFIMDRWDDAYDAYVTGKSGQTKREIKRALNYFDGSAFTENSNLQQALANGIPIGVEHVDTKDGQGKFDDTYNLTFTLNGERFTVPVEGTNIVIAYSIFGIDSLAATAKEIIDSKENPVGQRFDGAIDLYSKRNDWN